MPASQADAPLQQRLRAVPREQASPARPPDIQSDVLDADGRVRIVMPLPRLNPFAAVAMLFPAAIAMTLRVGAARITLADVARVAREDAPVALAAAVVAVSLVTFFGDAPGIPVLPTPFHQAAVTLAILIWSALRFGQRGAVTTNFCLTTVAVLATASHHGPFVVADPHTNLLSLQTSIAIVAISCLLLGAALSERRWALEQAHQALSDAERANSAKTAFMQIMSHELRTPLNAIAGFTELLCTGVYGALNPKQIEALGRIQRNEKELLAQIDAVLTFVQLESGETALHSEPVPVIDAFDAVEPTIAPEVRSKHFVLQRELPTTPLSVRADRQGLQQLLTSLVSNASKFTKDGGVITLGAERMDGRVRIWVRDTGVGISQEKIDQVFEPFFQAERGTTRQFDGVGLGLTIARQLARGMAGELNITSEEGAGTTASVLLPAA